MLEDTRVLEDTRTLDFYQWKSGSTYVPVEKKHMGCYLVVMKTALQTTSESASA